VSNTGKTRSCLCSAIATASHLPHRCDTGPGNVQSECLGRQGYNLTTVSFGRSSQLTLWNTPLTLKAHFADAFGWTAVATSPPDQQDLKLQCTAMLYLCTRKQFCKHFLQLLIKPLCCSCLLWDCGINTSRLIAFLELNCHEHL